MYNNSLWAHLEAEQEEINLLFLWMGDMHVVVLCVDGADYTLVSHPELCPVVILGLYLLPMRYLCEGVALNGSSFVQPVADCGHSMAVDNYREENIESCKG